MTENDTASETMGVRQPQATEISAWGRVKFYQAESYAIDNRLIDLKWRSWQSSPHRKDLLTSGHRACQGCGEALGVRCAVDMTSVVASNRITAVNTTGCLEVLSASYPETAWTIPRLHSLSGNVATVASEATAGLRAVGRLDIRAIAQGRDGGTAGIGVGCLSGMFERSGDVLYICYDNQAYMNIGVQRSGTTPLTACTAITQPVRPHPGNVFIQDKSMACIAMAHGTPYVATTTVVDLRDLEHKIGKAVSSRGARYIHVLAPCSLGWGSNSNLAVTLARLATQTGLFPALEAEGGEITSVAKIRRPVPVEEYLRPQCRLAHISKDPGSEALITRLQVVTDRNISRCGLVETGTPDGDVQCRILQAPHGPTGRFAVAGTCPAPIPTEPPNPASSIAPNSAPGAVVHGSASPTPQPIPSASQERRSHG